MRHDCSHMETFARNSFNYLIHNYDQRLKVPYFWTFLRQRPPEFRHDAWDVGDGMGRRLDALVTCRLMTGETAGRQREEEFRQTLYGCFRQPHGLLWRPETPWCQGVAEMMDQASCIFPVVSDFLETGSAKAQQIIDGLIAGLTAIAVRDGQGWYFPGSTYFPNGWTASGAIAAGPHDHRQDETWLEGDPAYYGRLLIPFTKYAQVTGSKAAMALCEAMAYNIVYQSKRYAEDGGFSREMHGEASVWTNGHFHSRFATAAGLVRYGRLAGKQEYIDFARKVFDWGLKQGTAFGWLPEFAGRKTREEGCETCTITDAIDLACEFGQLGDPMSFEIAERFASNQLVESQVWDVGFCDKPEQADTEMASFDHVADRAVGGFAGWSAPNDLISGYDDPGWDKDGTQPRLRRTLMDCCGGYGNRGLYLAWHNVAVTSGGTVSVHMLLGRRTSDVTVQSFLPQQDLVRITLHADKTLRVRMPSSAQASAVAATSSGRKMQFQPRGGYLDFGKLPAGTAVELAFGFAARRESITLGHEGFNDLKTYEVEWLGDRVTAVSPAGGFAPIYNHRLQSKATPNLPLHLPAKEIDW